MELTASFKEHFRTTANKLKGSERRKYMAEVSQQLDSQQQTSRKMGWNRETIRKGLRELITYKNSRSNSSPAGIRGAARMARRLLRVETFISHRMSAERVKAACEGCLISVMYKWRGAES